MAGGTDRSQMLFGVGVIVEPPAAVSAKVTVPRRAPMPTALMELMVASAVAAPAVRVPAKRKLAIVTITIKVKRSRITVRNLS